MHPTVYEAFEKIIGGLSIAGRVLEIGAVPKPASLLTMPMLRSTERIGLNLKGGITYDGFEIVAANANAIPFPDGHFDCVLSNAVIEHDPFFWKTCTEMRRVLRTGGVAIIGAPGFVPEADLSALGIASALDDAAENATLTFRYHGAPKDYYRFSAAAFREVIFRDYRDVALKTVLVPPRIIGYGFAS